MNGLQQSGSFTVPPKALAAIRENFAAGRASESETSATIASVLAESGYLLDPHTAVGVHVARTHELGAAPVVTLATAHPAKFPAAVKAASGVEPALPAWLSDLYDRPERFDVLANDQGAVEAYIRARSRAGRS
jgi:threonine synthase